MIWFDISETERLSWAPSLSTWGCGLNIQNPQRLHIPFYVAKNFACAWEFPLVHVTHSQSNVFAFSLYSLSLSSISSYFCSFKANENIQDDFGAIHLTLKNGTFRKQVWYLGWSAKLYLENSRFIYLLRHEVWLVTLDWLNFHSNLLYSIVLKII